MFKITWYFRTYSRANPDDLRHACERRFRTGSPTWLLIEPASDFVRLQNHPPEGGAPTDCSATGRAWVASYSTEARIDSTSSHPCLCPLALSSLKFGDDLVDDYPPILNSQQVAQLLGMDVMTVRRAAKDGTIPSYRLPGGRTYKFFRDEVLDWIKAHPVGPTVPQNTEPKPPIEQPMPNMPANEGTVEAAIRRAITEGQRLHTPTFEAPFTVDRIDTDGIVLLLGKGEWQTRLSWQCLEGIVPYVRSLGGVVDLGGQHQVKGRPGTLDAYLKTCVKRTTAGWVAVVLEMAGVVEIVHERPARVRLI